MGITKRKPIGKSRDTKTLQLPYGFRYQYWMNLAWTDTGSKLDFSSIWYAHRMLLHTTTVSWSDEALGQKLLNS